MGIHEKEEGRKGEGFVLVRTSDESVETVDFLQGRWMETNEGWHMLVSKVASS